MRSLFVTSAVAASVLLCPTTANAIDGTWTGFNSNVFENALNWSSNPAVPDGTATFTGNGAPTNPVATATVFLGSMQFTAGAPSFTVSAGDSIASVFIVMTGAGVVNNSGVEQTFVANATSAVVFANAATSGGATLIANGGAIQFNDTSTGTSSRFISNGGILNIVTPGAAVSLGSIEGSGVIRSGGQLTTGSLNTDTTYSGAITDLGVAASIVKVGTGTLTLTGANSYTGGTTITAGTIAITDAAALGTGAVAMNGGTLRSDVTATLANNIDVNGGTAATVVAGNGQTLTLTGQFLLSANSSATVVRFGQAGGTGVIDFNGVATFGAPGNYASFDVLGGTVIASSVSFADLTARAATTTIAAGATLIDLPSGGVYANLQSAGTFVVAGQAEIAGGQSSGVISGAGGLRVRSSGLPGGGSGVLVLSGTNTYSGGTELLANTTLQLGSGGTTGSILGNVTNAGTLAFNRSNLYQFDGVVSGTGAVRQIGSGVTNLTAANTYTGATSVLAGTLLVNGSIATSSGLTVAAGATVGGIGTLPGTVINGTLSPGNSIGTIRVAGNLAFGGSGVYLVEVGSATADRTDVTGNASLAGTARFIPSGQALAFGTRYTILNATGGVTGAFASVDSQLGAAFRPTLSYDANNAFLTLNAGALAPTLSGLTGNQQAVVVGLDRGVADGGNANPLLPIFLLPAGSAPAALDQLSGEVHTAAQGLGVLVSGQFLNTMLDPYALGRTPGSNPALAYAPDMLGGLQGVVAATQAADLSSGVRAVDPHRFGLWAAAFGSDGRLGGDPAIGSARRSERSSGIAAGADWRVLPGTIFGVALAGGGADASLSNGLGSVSAEVFQAGAYAMTRLGDVDLRAAFAYSRLDLETTRAIPVLGLSNVNASNDADVWSGRIEGSLAIAAFAGLSVSPLAAFQIQSVHRDGFTETVPGGGGPAAGLTVAGQTSTTSRAELGARFETSFGAPGSGVTAFARLAWAHYFERDNSVTATLGGLPGSAFTVVGARPDRDSALVSTGLDIRITPQISLGARFDGEFSDNLSQYAGTARIRIEF